MSVTMQLPPAIEHELEEGGGQGISALDRAWLLLLLAKSITKKGQSSPFGNAVRTILISRSIDPDHVASAMDDLLKLCSETIVLESVADIREILTTKADSLGFDDAQNLLNHWRALVIHLPNRPEVPMDFSADVVISDLSRLDGSVQRAGRVDRTSAFGKYAFLPGGSEEFAREKQFEIEKEDRPRP